MGHSPFYAANLKAQSYFDPSLYQTNNNKVESSSPNASFIEINTLNQ